MQRALDRALGKALAWFRTASCDILRKCGNRIYTQTHTHTYGRGHPLTKGGQHGRNTAFNFGIFFGLSSWLSFLLNLSCLRFHAALAILCQTHVVLPIFMPHIYPHHPCPILVLYFLALYTCCGLTLLLSLLLLLLVYCLLFICLFFSSSFSFFFFYRRREIEFESLSDILVIKSEIFATLLFSTFS